MDCFHPLNLKDRGVVPCGKCVACLLRRQSDWTIRLTQELRDSTSCYFLTLTYNEESVPTFNGTNVLRKRDAQLFIKRLRKWIEPHKIRYFLCGEYGSKTLRPHYHAIIFNLPSEFAFNVFKRWPHGFVSIATVTPARIAYVAKYCSCYTFLPSFYKDKRFRPFSLSSRHPAIGHSYLEDDRILSYHRETLDTTFRQRDGIPRSLPRYYRDRIFDDQMKLDIRDRVDEYRKKRDQEFHSKYLLNPDYNYSDIVGQMKRDVENKYYKTLYKSKL